jgi:chemotaxis protein methyltransferase CheR
VKSKIINQFAGALNPGGYLVLGASESITGLTDKFEMIRCNPGIIYKLKS